MIISALRKLCLAKHQYHTALLSIRSSNEFAICTGLIQLQDSVESFLLAVAEHLEVEIKENSNFHSYIDSINKKIDPRILPYRQELNRLNKLRVNAKHYAIFPNQKEVESLKTSIANFFVDVSGDLLETNFATATITDAFDKEDVKLFLDKAYTAYEKGAYPEVLVQCRRAIFLDIEKDYDISMFKDGEKPKGLLGPYSSAPHYALNQEYIKTYVKEPTGYIVLDHGKLDAELTKNGADHSTFWNIWRITPSVYCDADGKWYTKHEYGLFDEEGIEDRADYVLQAATDILISRSIYRSKFKPGIFATKKVLVPKGTPIFEYTDVTNTKPTDIMSEDIIGDAAHEIVGLDGNHYCYIIFFPKMLSSTGYVLSEMLKYPKKEN
ncbi:MAG: hypothetical protein OCC46_09175 [Pseudodesulfovibrio sp.]